MTKIATGLWLRGAKLMGLASKVAVNEITSRLKTWEDEKNKIHNKVELAQALVKTMSELKGASMKMGQLLSMDLGDYFPPEVIKILESLHQNSTYLSSEKINEILRNELGDKLNHLAEFSSTPLAAASIGQVHTAKLYEKDVVIKIQYPGVAESIPSDLKLLKLILNNLAGLQGKEVDLAPFLKEVEEVLMLETDYRNELEMQKRYRLSFQDSEYVIPEVYPDFSTDKIITMEKLEGRSLTSWLEKSLLGERMKLADSLMNLYLQEFFIHGLVQTDPNPGNFLITHEDRLALLDFGAVKMYHRNFIESYRSVLKAAFHQDMKKVLSLSEEMNFINARESQETKEIYLNMIDILAAPFRQKEPFDFGDKKFYELSRDLSWELARKCKYSPPPKDLLFLHRKLAGVFLLIKKLQTKIVLRNYWPQIANEDLSK